MRERVTFEREMEALLGVETAAPPMEGETFDRLRARLTRLAFFPHWTRGGTALRMTPALMDPGFYDGANAYKRAPSLQVPLEALLKKSPFGGSRVALVDLTKNRDAPEFAGVRHQEQAFIASVPKIVPLYAAFQMQHDLRAMARRRNPLGASVFDWARELWADTQHDPGGNTLPFTKDITKRGNLVLVRGQPVPLVDPRAPRLDAVFAKDGPPFDFASAHKTRDQLDRAIKNFSRGGTSTTERLGKAAIDELAFFQRMMIVGGGLVPASNFGTATLIRDLGFPYLASTLLQSGLYDPARGGGLWLGADFQGIVWRGAPAGGPAQSGTAGSLAAFMTLLAQDRLVSPTASQGIRNLLDKDTAVAPTLQSPFEEGLEARYGPARVFEKVGGAAGAVDECAYIEWPAGTPRLKYVAISLRSSNAVLKRLIIELHRIVAANNGVTLSPP